MRQFRIALVVAAWLSAGAAAAADRIDLATEDYWPFNFRDGGQIVGIATELVLEMTRRADVQIGSHSLMPWPRAYEAALNQPATCVYSTTVTEDREPLFTFIAPLVSNDWVLFARTYDPRRPARIEDLRGTARIGVYQGDAIEGFLQRAGGYTLDSAPRDDLNPRKLEGGRVDFWATSSLTGPHYARQQGVTGIREVLQFRSTRLGLACNRALPKPVAARLDAALAAMHRDGTVAAAHAKYLPAGS